MDRKAEIETERDVLKRIVALLFALANLAERVSNRSYPVRGLVLWLLRRAEIVARDWVAADGADDLQIAPSSPVVLHRNSRAEAMVLAASFRALAHMLKRELCLEARLARRLMRGKADRASAGAQRRNLLAVGSFCRFVRTISIAICCLHGFGSGAVPQLDTS